MKRFSGGNTKGFFKVGDQLEQCWLDLKNVDLSAELNTANVMNHIEKILPTVQKREGVIMSVKINNAIELFSKLL